MTQRTLAPLALALLAAVCFANALHGAFQLDDFYRVVNNPGIHGLHPAWRHFTDPRTMSTLDVITQYRPMLPLTLSVNYAIAGDSVVGYHLGNLLLHVAATLMVYWLALELLMHWAFARNPATGGAAIAHAGCTPPAMALTVAAIFAVHPVSGITVNYISARDLVLMQLFLVASLLAYVRMRRLGETPRRWAGVLLLLALSLLSKTNAAAAALLVLAFEVTAGGESLATWRPWRRPLPFALVVAAFFGVTRFVLGFSDFTNVLSDAPVGAGPYALTQLKVHLFHYGRNFFWPFPIRLAPLIAPATSLFEPRVALGAALIVATFAAAWRLRARAPLAAFCILAYWALMVPESSLLPLNHLAVDYRPYASSPFLYLAIALVVTRYANARVAAAVAAAAVVYFGAASVLLNRTWRSGEALWTHSLRYGGDELAHLNLAMSIADRRDPRVRVNLERALELKPNYIAAHTNYGLLLIELGERERGLEHCRRAVELDPRLALSRYWLSEAYRRLGRSREAAGESAMAAQLDPRSAEYAQRAQLDGQIVRVLHLGAALANRGRCAEAIPHFLRVAAARPEDEEAKRGLVRCAGAGRAARH